jgi:serine/threonine protein phosphatase 1
MRGRTIAIGDIHGCDAALAVLLRELAPTTDDTVVVLGDVVDRGPDTRACIDRLLELRESCRLIHLMGNHEEMALDALAGGLWSQAWPKYGGDEMLASYGGSFDDIPPVHLDFIRSGKDYFETESTIFAHATIRPDLPLEQQSIHYLRWNRLTGREQPHESGRRVVCGHTAQPDGRPVVFDGWVCLDTCAYCPRGVLSALVIEDDVLYQADQSGAARGPTPLADFVAA